MELCKQGNVYFYYFVHSLTNVFKFALSNIILIFFKNIVYSVLSYIPTHNKVINI